MAEPGGATGVAGSLEGLERAGLALVTGASTGIGRELARQLAERGYDLLLVADEHEVKDVAEEVSSGDTGAGVAATAVVADLADPAGDGAVAAALAVDGRTPSVAALNAGRGAGGRFDEIPLEDDVAVVRLNVEGTVRLAKLVVPPMVRAGAGRVLITSSIAATAPGPFHATYAASKAFGHSFAEALREELRDTGVTVTSLMPGPTDTAFFERAGMTDTPVGSGPQDDPAEVARDGLEALFDGTDKVVAGSRRNAVQAVASRVTPDTVAAKAQRRQAEPPDRDGG